MSLEFDRTRKHEAYNPKMSTAQICLECGGTGWRRSVDRVGVTRCDCLKRSRVERLFFRAGIPERYRHCDFENFHSVRNVTTKSVEIAKIVAEEFVNRYPAPPPQTGLLFVGNPGAGKTHLAVALIKALIRLKSIPCLFRSFPELLKDIQSTYDPISQSSEYAIVEPVLQTEVLALDELGAKPPSAWVQDTVGYILNTRYNENKVTMLTTNYPDRDPEFKSKITDTLVDRIGERIRSRLYEMCKTVPMNGRDFREAVMQGQHQL